MIEKRMTIPVNPALSLVVVIDMIEVSVGVAGFGLKSAMAPNGRPLTVRVQGEAKPHSEVRITSKSTEKLA